MNIIIPCSKKKYYEVYLYYKVFQLNWLTGLFVRLVIKEFLVI